MFPVFSWGDRTYRIRSNTFLIHAALTDVVLLNTQAAYSEACWYPAQVPFTGWCSYAADNMLVDNSSQLSPTEKCPWSNLLCGYFPPPLAPLSD